MRYYGGTLEFWLDEPLCVVVYQFQYARKWELEDKEKFELLLMGKQLSDQIS